MLGADSMAMAAAEATPVNLGAPSANKVLRHLKRQEQGLYNCIASVVADAAFVQEVRPRWWGIGMRVQNLHSWGHPKQIFNALNPALAVFSFEKKGRCLPADGGAAPGLLSIANLCCGVWYEPRSSMEPHSRKYSLFCIADGRAAPRAAAGRESPLRRVVRAVPRRDLLLQGVIKSST